MLSATQLTFYLFLWSKETEALGSMRRGKLADEEAETGFGEIYP